MLIKYQQKSQRLAVPSMGKRVEKQELQHAAGGKLMSPHQKTLGMSKRVKMSHSPSQQSHLQTETLERASCGSSRRHSKRIYAKSATLKCGDTEVSSAVGKLWHGNMGEYGAHRTCGKPHKYDLESKVAD